MLKGLFLETYSMQNIICQLYDYVLCAVGYVFRDFLHIKHNKIIYGQFFLISKRHIPGKK